MRQERPTPTGSHAAPALLRVGGAIFVVMGGLHGLATLVDVVHPTFFTPVDDAVRGAMIGEPVALSPHLELWGAWLGFNLSHAMGAVLFGALPWLLTRRSAEGAVAPTWLSPLAVIVSSAYLALSLAFWFRVPAVGSAMATACFAAAILFQGAREEGP